MLRFYNPTFQSMKRDEHCCLDDIKDLSQTLQTLHSLADTAFLIAIYLVYNKVACKLIAIVLHWAFLSVQTWTAVMAFDILSKFRLVTLKQGKSNSRCFLEYCWLGYTLPSLILVVTVTLNETKVDDIGYGESNTCFIHIFDAKFYFYIIHHFQLRSFLQSRFVSLLYVSSQNGNLNFEDGWKVLEEVKKI